MAEKLAIRLRPAERADIPAIATMVLTSFRQFPLVWRFYRPLISDRDAARDTMWYWDRRLRLAMLDPTKRVVVAEAVSTEEASKLLLERRAATRDRPDDEVTAESWRMLDWSSRFLQTAEPGLVASPLDRRPRLILGFAIWMIREPAATRRRYEERQVVRHPGWLAWVETLWIKFELWAWGLVYQRKDQDASDDPIYEKAEEELARNYYSDKTYYHLDNLTVDFRAHRLGIGYQLLARGLREAREMGWNVSTEASAKGEYLYRKAGFEQVGIWQN